MPPIRSVDVRAALQVATAAFMSLSAPQPKDGVAVALAFAAAVEEQHAVAVADEIRAGRCGPPAPARDDGGAVPRRDVPA